MNKRQIIIMIAGVAFLAGSIFLSGFLTKDKQEKPKEFEMLTAVKSQRMSSDTLVRTLRITGRLIPKQSVKLYAEVGGRAIFGSKPLKEGVSFNKGEVMLRINSDELQSSLSAKRSSFQSLLASVIPDLKLDFTEVASSWEDYLFEIDIDKKLPALPAVEDKKLKLFLSGRKVFSEYYSVTEMETRYDKHTIRSPFNGSLISAQVDEGSLVRIGQPLGEIISSGQYEIEAGISYTDASFLSIGTVFTMQDINTGREYKAKVIRVNDSVDPQTQQVKIYAAIDDASAKSGIYLEGKIPAGEITNAISIPLEALVGENMVYFVEDSIAILKKVDVAYKTGEAAIISGIEGKVDVILDKHNEALNGSKVAPINLNR
jgi:multidrug efflux pump subunit AcrA (membrane-fusion protein)